MRYFAFTVLIFSLACGKRAGQAPLVAGGDAARGRLAVRKYGCGACHTIPGIAGAHGLVGPPLNHVGERVFIAGVLPNAPQSMVRWIENPPAVDDKTAMPNLGVTERDARDIAEFLYRIR